MPAFDAGSSAGGSVSELSWSHTCTGSDRFLVVGIHQASGNSVTGVTYNGVSMTRLGTIGDTNRQWYTMVAPAAGTNTIVAIWSGGAANSVGVAASYTGVDQTTPFDGLVSSTTQAGEVTVTVSSASGHVVLGGVAAGHIGPITTAVGAGQTSRTSREESNMALRISDEGGGESVDHSYTVSETPLFDRVTWAVNLRDSPAAPPPAASLLTIPMG